MSANDLRIIFKLGKSQKDTLRANVGFGVEQLSGGMLRNHLNNISHIYDFGLFFAFLNTSVKNKCAKWGIACQDLHPSEVLCDLLSHLVTLARVGFEQNHTSKSTDSSKAYSAFFVENRLVSYDIDFSFNIVSGSFEGGRFGRIGSHKDAKNKHITFDNLATFVEFVENTPRNLEWDEISKTPENLFVWDKQSVLFAKNLQSFYIPIINDNLRIQDNKLVFINPFANDKDAYIKAISSVDPQTHGLVTYATIRCIVFIYICATFEGLETNAQFPDVNTKHEIQFFPLLGEGPSYDLTTATTVSGGKGMHPELLKVIEPPPQPPPDTDDDDDHWTNVPSTKSEIRERAEMKNDRKGNTQNTNITHERDLYELSQMSGGGAPYHNAQAGGLYNLEGVQYDLFATIYILKSAKWLWYSFLMKKKQTIDKMDILIEQVLSLLVFASLDANVTTYIMDQVCTLVVYAGYLKLLRGKPCDKTILSGILLFPYYVLFL